MDQYGCVCVCVIVNYRTALNCTFDVNLAIFGIVMTAKSCKSPGGAHTVVFQFRHSLISDNCFESYAIRN